MMRARTITFTGENGEKQENAVIKVGAVAVGNNFTMLHFVDNLSVEQVDFIKSVNFDLDANVRIVAGASFGNCVLNTCGNDLADFLRGL